MYEKITPEFENMQTFIKRINDDGTESFIPEDEANTDYQAYLVWLSEQETSA